MHRACKLFESSCVGSKLDKYLIVDCASNRCRNIDQFWYMRRTQSSGKNLHRRGRTSQIKRLKGTGASYNKVTLGTPHFLLSHLKLLSALIASTCLPEKQSTGVAISSLEIIGLRKGIVQRLCYNFPAEAYALQCFMRGALCKHYHWLSL